MSAVESSIPFTKCSLVRWLSALSKKFWYFVGSSSAWSRLRVVALLLQDLRRGSQKLCLSYYGVSKRPSEIMSLIGKLVRALHILIVRYSSNLRNYTCYFWTRPLQHWPITVYSLKRWASMLSVYIPLSSESWKVCTTPPVRTLGQFLTSFLWTEAPYAKTFALPVCEMFLSPTIVFPYSFIGKKKLRLLGNFEF